MNFSWTSYELFAIHPSLLLPLLPEVEARVNLILNWNEDHGGYIPEDADAAKIQRLYEMGEKIFWTISKLEDETKERRGVDSLRFNDLAHAKQNAKILRVIAARPDDRVALNKVMDLWHQAQQFRLLAAQIVG